MNLFTEDYLIHHGIKGQKWGVRRFQNDDGSLTTAGRKRYITDEMRAEGAREDTASYKYNKSGESGWKGLGRAISTAAVKKRHDAEQMKQYGAREDAAGYKYQRPGESAWKGVGRAIIRKPVSRESSKTDESSNKKNTAGKEVLLGIGRSVAANMLASAAVTGLNMATLTSVADGNNRALGLQAASNIVQVANSGFQIGNIASTAVRANRARK